MINKTGKRINCMEMRETGDTTKENRKSRVGGQDIGEKFKIS
jgi:hypothetical protein